MASIAIHGLTHIGIRVRDLERSLRFYRLLGFKKTAGPIGPVHRASSSATPIAT